ncbi:hypothetical protein CD33_13975 [Ureibacillus sinduriensis BLB-1 = JCM 15800]|uniref:Uncharacterized protein n=1 Tax=Ureibacillus sinduriensis BLB-1 = JCM 15800 TaxID=1384057 RepID=A0A0A3HUJ4_9BACL|nr:hypothetical protein CD33_13975 [Ureibacillus sinduriensis BLB-1 = JCM 15800]
MPDIENPMVSPILTDDPFAQQVGKCHYRHCEEVVYEEQGIKFDGYIYCSTSCLGEDLLAEGVAVDLSK